MFQENLNNIGKLENFKVQNLLITVTNQFFLITVIFSFIANISILSFINLSIIILGVLDFHQLTLIHPQQLQDFNKTKSFRMFSHFNSGYIRIVALLQMIQISTFLFAQILVEFSSSYVILVLNAFIRDITFGIIDMSYLDFIFFILFFLFNLKVFLINKDRELYYDYYTFKIYRKIFQFAQLPLFMLLVYLLYVRSLYENKWAIINICEHSVNLFFMVKMFVQYGGDFWEKVYQLIRVLKFFTLIKIFIILTNIALIQFIDIFSINLKNQKIHALFFEFNIMSQTNNKEFVVVFFCSYFLTLNYISFIKKFNSTFTEEKGEIKYQEIFQQSHQLQLVKKFSKKLLKMLNIMNKNHPAITLNYGLKYNFFKELKQIHFFKKNFQISLKARFFSQNVPFKFWLYEKLEKVYSILYLNRFIYIKIALDFVMISLLLSMIKNFNLFSFMLYTQIVLLIVLPDFILIKIYFTLVSLLPISVHIFLQILNKIEIKVNSNQFIFFSQYTKAFEQYFSLSVSQIFLIFVINISYIYCIQFLHKEINKKKDFSIFQILKNQNQRVIEIDEDLQTLIYNVMIWLLIQVRYFICFLILLKCLYTTSIFSLLVLSVMFFAFIFESEIGHKIMSNVILSICTIKFIIKDQNIFPKLSSKINFFYGLFYNLKPIKNENEFEYEVLYFEFQITLLSLYFLINRLRVRKERVKKSFLNQKYSELLLFYRDFQNQVIKILNTVKVFLIYFYMLNACLDINIKEMKLFAFLEFIFTVFMISYHLSLLIIKRHIRSKVFFFFFVMYLFFIVSVFLINYFTIFQNFLQFSEANTTEGFTWEEISGKNFAINSRNATKIILCVIAIKTLYKNLGQSQETQQMTGKTRKYKEIIIKIIQVISVFVKEIQLLITIKIFIESPNIFGFLYLGIYLIYFVNQIDSLLKIMAKYKLNEILYLKYLYFQNYLLRKGIGDLPQLQFFFDDFYKNSGIYYYSYLQKEIFFCIYTKVNRNWKFSYMILTIYMITVYIFYFIEFDIQKAQNSLFYNIVFNFSSYETEVIKAHFEKLIGMLAILIVEIYFVNALKLKDRSQDDLLSQNITYLLEAKLKFLSSYSNNKAHLLQNQEKFLIGVKKSLEQVKVFVAHKDIEPLVEKHALYQEDSEVKELFKVFNLNQKLDDTYKSLLLVQNTNKMNYLQLLNGFFYFFRKILLLPISLGFVLGSGNAAYVLIGFSLLFIQVKTQVTRKHFIFLNISLSFICIMEYLFLYFSKYILLFNKLEYIQSHLQADSQIKVLLYMFSYASLFKCFFMASLIVSYYGLLYLDFIKPEFYTKVKQFKKKSQKSLVVNYSDWVKNSFTFYNYIKDQILMNAGSLYFLLNFFYFSFSMRLLQLIGLLSLIMFKILFNFKFQKPFNFSISNEYRSIYLYFNFLYWAIFFAFLTNYNLPISYSVLGQTTDQLCFVCLFYLNMLILSLFDKQEVLEEIKKLEKKDYLRHKLIALLNVYQFNEENTFKNTQQLMKVKLMENKLQQIFPDDQVISKKGKLLKDCELENELKNISVFVKDKEYENFLFSQLGSVHRVFIKLRIYFRTKLFLSYSSSKNQLALLSQLVEKNKHFIGENYALDLFKIMSGEVEDVRLLLQKVEFNNTLFKQKHYVQTVHDRMDFFIKNNTPHTPMIPMTGRFKKVPQQTEYLRGIHQARDFFYTKLINDDQTQQVKKAPDNTFFEYLYKHKIDKDTVMLILNYDQINCQLNDYKNINFTVNQYIFAIMNIFKDNLNFFLNFILILIFTFSEGLIGVIFVFIHIYFIMIENKILNTSNWKKSYILFLVTFLIKISLLCKYNFVSQENEEVDGSFPSEKVAVWVFFFFGKMSNSYLILVLCIYEVVLSRIGNKTLEKNFSEVENNSQAIFRLSFNQNLEQIFDRKNKLILANFFFVEEKVKQEFKKILSEKDYTIFIVKLLKRKIHIYKDLKMKFNSYFQTLKNLVPVYNQDKLYFTNANQKNYFWRNFNCYLRKPGENYTDYLTALLVLMIVFTFFFFFSLIRIEKSIFQSIMNNEIQGMFSILITIFFFFICLERYMVMGSNYNWMSNTQNHRDQVISILKSKNINLKRIEEKTDEGKTIKLKQLIKKFMTILRLKIVSKVDPREHYKHNPLIYRFKASILFWIFVCVVVHFVLPINSHNMINKNSKSNSLLCNDYFQTEKSTDQVTVKCNNYSNNVYLRIFFMLANLYAIVSIIQIKRGYSHITNIKYVDYKSPIEKVKFYIYKYTPFLREMRTLLDYTASSTSLNLFQYLKLEDMETAVSSARMNQIQSQNRFESGQRFRNKAIGFIFFIFFYVLLIIPLFIFSDIIPSKNINEILQASFTGKIKTQFMDLDLYTAQDTFIQKFQEDSNDFLKIQSLQIFKRYDSEYFSKMTFNKITPLYIDYTDIVVHEVKKQLTQQNFLTIVISLELLTKHKGKILFERSFDLTYHSSVLLFQLLKNQSCKEDSSNRFTLGQQQRMLTMNTESKSLQQNFNTDIFDYIMVLEAKCNQINGKISFDLSDQNSQNISFFVLSENIKSSVEYLEKFYKDQVSLFSIYLLIFSYIGITIIRKGFFDQSHTLWITEMPNAERLEIFSNLIFYSKYKGDLYREELFYYQMIDLFRDPSKIKEITGELINPYAKKREIKWY